MEGNIQIIERDGRAPMYIISHGRVCVRFFGEFKTSVKYKKLSITTVEGQSYISLKETQGVNPAVSVSLPEPEEGVKDWALLAARGESDYEALVRAGVFEGSYEEYIAWKQGLLTACSDAAARANTAAETTEAVIVSANAAIDTILKEIELSEEALQHIAQSSANANAAADDARNAGVSADSAAFKALAAKELAESTIINVNTQFDNKINEVNTAVENKITEVDTAVKNKITEVDTAVNNKLGEADKKIVETTEATKKANEAATTIDAKINPVIASDKLQNGRLDSLEGSVADLQKFYGADFCVGTYDDGQLAPEALETKGSRAFALDWYPWLVDMTDNAGPAVTRAWTLKKNNWFRYGISGEFAPAVCVTQEDYDLCNAELYLDAGHTQKYCEAGAFDAEAFYNKHGMNQPLYSVDGVEIAHIRRPWETTNKDLGIGVGRKDTIRLCDMLPGRSGKLIKGVFGSQTNYDGAQFSQFVLPPTIMSPTPVCTVSNKTRFFFYLMKGESNCASSKGSNNCSDLFTLEKKTYPRTNDMHQINDMKWSRANNAEPQSPVPFAEGGYFAYNTFISCMEIGYGTRATHRTEMFSSGISANDSCSGEESWNSFGGVRYRKQGDAVWSYGKWNTTPDMYHDAKGGRTNLSEFLNNYYPKAAVNEGQIALSYAAELGIQPDVEFQLYGESYWYQNVEGAVALLDGEMNARLYKKMGGIINAYNADGTPQAFEVEIILRIGIVQGMNISGDVFAYWGGGYEQVGHVKSEEELGGKYGSDIDFYIQPDQSQWLFEDAYEKNEGEKFAFEDSYIFAGSGKNERGGYILKRKPYVGWAEKWGGSLLTGEGFYLWCDNWWGKLGKCTRIAARFRGNAAHSYCAPRSLHAAHAVASTRRYIAGSAQVLNRAPECNALQAQHEAQRSATMALQKSKKKEQKKTDVSSSPSDEVKNPA